MRPPHLFLDLDGTLTDPRNGIVGSITHALSVLGRPVPTAESLLQFIGPPLGRVFQTMLGTEDPDIIRAAVTAYREHFTSVGILENRPYPQIPESLNSLRGLGYVLYVVTSKPRVYAVRIVEHFDLAKHFTSVYGPALDDLNGEKATLIRTALTNEGIDSSAATMVGDRGEDVRGARENGVGAIGVTWGFGTPEELKDADRIVHSPSELVGWASEHLKGYEPSS
jgi:phosphoglycolate phosphatase